jgi:hypothetical protein
MTKITPRQHAWMSFAMIGAMVGAGSPRPPRPAPALPTSAQRK